MISLEVENQVEYTSLESPRGCRDYLILLLYTVLCYGLNVEGFVVLQTALYGDTYSIPCQFHLALWQTLPILALVLPQIYHNVEHFSGCTRGLWVVILANMIACGASLLWKEDSCVTNAFILAFFHGMFGGCCGYLMLHFVTRRTEENPNMF